VSEAKKRYVSVSVYGVWLEFENGACGWSGNFSFDKNTLLQWVRFYETSYSATIRAVKVPPPDDFKEGEGT
jgi:hypothetical protein